MALPVVELVALSYQNALFSVTRDTETLGLSERYEYHFRSVKRRDTQQEIYGVIRDSIDRPLLPCG